MLVFNTYNLNFDVKSADKALVLLLLEKTANIYSHIECISWSKSQNPFGIAADYDGTRLTVLNRHLAVGKYKYCLVVRRTDGHPRTIYYDMRDIGVKITSFEEFLISRDNLVVFCHCTSDRVEYPHVWFAFDTILETFTDITDILHKSDSCIIENTCRDTYTSIAKQSTDTILLSKYTTITSDNFTLKYNSLSFSETIKVNDISENPNILSNFWNFGNYIYGILQVYRRCIVVVYTDTMMLLSSMSYKHTDVLPYLECIVSEEHVIFYPYNGDVAIVLKK